MLFGATVGLLLGGLQVVTTPRRVSWAAHWIGVSALGSALGRVLTGFAHRLAPGAPESDLYPLIFRDLAITGTTYGVVGAIGMAWLVSRDGSPFRHRSPRRPRMKN